MHPWSILLIACSFVILSQAHYLGNFEDDEPLMRMRRSPVRMMVHGYMLRHPQVAMTAYASGPFYGRRGGCANCNQVAPVEDETPAVTGEDEGAPVEEVTSEEAATVDQTEAPEPKEVKEDKEEREPKEAKVPRKPKASRHPVQVDEDDDDDEDDEEEVVVPISRRRKGSRAQGPSYQNFFPMMFAARGSSGRSDDDESGLNPGLTAIANSFSTGKGAIAASTATAYGGASAPSASQLRRGSPSRYRSS